MADEEGWQVAGGKRCSKRCRVPAAKHASSGAVLYQLPWGTEKPSPQHVGRWRAKVDATASELADTAFYIRMRHVLEAATLPPPLAYPNTSTSSPATAGMASSTAVAASPRLLPTIRCLVVYGLGSLEQPGGAHIRCQLALALRLAAMLPGLGGRPQAFDPVFTGLDRAVLPALGVEVLEHNEGGARVAGEPTLAYLPHCEETLTDALLAANVAAGTLANLAILGNRLSIYPERWDPLQPCPATCARVARQAGGTSGTSSSGASSGARQQREEHQEHRQQQGQQQSGRHGQEGHHDWRRQRQRPDTLLRLCASGAVVEVPVGECGFPVVSAFNDLALHTFKPDWQQRLSEGAAAAPHMNSS